MPRIYSPNSAHSAFHLFFLKKKENWDGPFEG